MKKIIFIVFALLIISSANSQENKKELTICSFNVRYNSADDGINIWENRKDWLTHSIRFYQTDLIGTQEVTHTQLMDMQELLPNYVYVGIGREGDTQGEYSAIFYKKDRFEVIESNTFWLSETPDNVSVGWDAALERICTYGLFKDKVTKENFWVFNTHYDHIGVLAREKSSELILNKIDEVNSALLPVILMGDLNSEPNSRPIKILKTKLNDALEISSTILYGPTGTFNGFNKNLNIDKRIDYFFTSELETLSYAHIDDRLDDNKHISDHLPIFITIKIITAKKD